MTLADQLREDGLRSGLLKGRQGAVILLLEERFGNVPDAIRTAIVSIRDEGRLRDLQKLALRLQTLEEFAAEV